MRARRHFERLALPHLPAVYRLARQLGGPDRADDLTQETFLRAWTHFDQFDPASNCRAWLLRILHNAWVSHWRKTRLELPMADVPESRVELSYEWDETVTLEALSDDVQWALDQLPEPFRWAVLLADVEELTYQEMAATMECPIGTVMSRVSRGRRLLAQHLRARRSAGRLTPFRAVSKE